MITYIWSTYVNGKLDTTCEFKGGRTAAQKIRRQQAQEWAVFGKITLSKLKSK